MIRSWLKRALTQLHLIGPVRRLLGRSPQHGHSLLMRILASQRPSVGYLVEVGTTREKTDGQGSTVLLANLARDLGLEFVTIDMDPINTARAREDLLPLANAQAVTAKGEEYLTTLDQPVAAAYLDAFDIDHPGHSDYRHGRYRALLGVEINNEAAALMHEACARALMPRMAAGGVIVIDDTWTEGGRFIGKGATAVPLLIANGYRIIGRTRTAVGLRQVDRPR